MPRNTVCEIDLGTLRDPVATGLEAYLAQADGRLKFDVGHASTLVQIPGKHTYARNTAEGTPVAFSDGSEATLWTIAFMPKDGTGDNSLSSSETAWLPGLPKADKVMPRSKEQFLAEVCMSLCAVDLDKPQRGPKLFAAHLQLLGLVNDAPRWFEQPAVAVGRIGELGASVLAFSQHEDLEPITSVTAGPVKGSALDITGVRRGDPHAVYSSPLPAPIVNVAGFIAIPRNASQEAFAALQSLNPVARFY